MAIFHSIVVEGNNVFKKLCLVLKRGKFFILPVMHPKQDKFFIIPNLNLLKFLF